MIIICLILFSQKHRIKEISSKFGNIFLNITFYENNKESVPKETETGSRTNLTDNIKTITNSPSSKSSRVKSITNVNDL